jgi:lipid A 3-O-deacylase
MWRTVVLASVLTPSVVCAQAIATAGLERDLRATSYTRVAYDNDFFTATDRYFTQGIAIEVVTPRLGQLPLRHVLYAPKDSRVRRGVIFEDDGYTASDLKRADILRGDHPYAGTKQLRAFAMSDDTLRRQRVTTSLNVGIIGQGAGGKEIQTFIHRRTGNTIPQGWGNQIRNDLILNYEAAMERAVWRHEGRALLTTTGVARVGTLNTAGTLGLTAMLGRIDDPFRATSSRREWYVYIKPQLNVVGYDATLQGGLFNRTSPYTIASRDVSRAVYRQSVGIVYRSRGRFIEYYQSLGTPEFRGARGHRSGGVQLGYVRGR